MCLGVAASGQYLLSKQLRPIVINLQHVVVQAYHVFAAEEEVEIFQGFRHLKTLHGIPF